MTEADWLACTDPRPMLEFLHGKASDRKLRLFACACCRRLWSHLMDERSRNAVQVAERVADGLATEEDRNQASGDAQAAWDASLKSASPPIDSPETQAAVRAAIETGRFWVWDLEVAAGAICDVLHKSAYVASVDVAEACASFISQTAGKQVASVECTLQASMLRCVLRNPFHTLPLDAAWLTPTVISLAQAVYAERNLPEGTLDPAQLAVLSDALEEAGCDNADILSHLRGPGPHVRGCWVIDLLLGKT
jgi:hypothetical protein